MDESQLRRILHKLRSEAHIARAFAQRQRQRERDEVAASYHEGEAEGLMQAVHLLEQAEHAGRPPHPNP